MNKIIKAIITILGGVNIVFNMFIPVAVGLLLINYFAFDEAKNVLIMVVAMISTFYRAIEVGFLKGRKKE